jgi:hypothetical protein
MHGKNEWQSYTVSSFAKAVRLIVMRSEKADRVTLLLQRQSSIDNQSLGTTDAEVRMQERHARHGVRV